jgi:PhnB protein
VGLPRPSAAGALERRETMARVKPIPEGYEAAIPYLCVKGGSDAIDFYRRAFGATEKYRMEDPSGKIGHAELHIRDAVIMLADEYPERGVLSPQSIAGSPVAIHLYVEDVDSVAERALAAGAKVLRAVEDQFYGDRAGEFEDPFGHKWWLSTRKEDLSVEEMKSRAAKLFGGA